MTIGTLKTQGSKLFFANSPSEILSVACPTGITGLGGTADQIEDTCLDSNEKTFVRGLLTPGTISVPFNVIPRSASHQALFTLRETGESIGWLATLSDYVSAVPSAVDSDGYITSPGSTTIGWLGYVSDLTIDIATNEIVRGTLTIQRSGTLQYDLPTADLA